MHGCPVNTVVAQTQSKYTVSPGATSRAAGVIDVESTTMVCVSAVTTETIASTIGAIKVPDIRIFN